MNTTDLSTKKVFGIRESKGFIYLYFPRDYLRDAIDNFPNQGILYKEKCIIKFSPLVDPNIREKLVLFTRKYNALREKVMKENLAKKAARLQNVNMKKILATRLNGTKQFYKAGYAVK